MRKSVFIVMVWIACAALGIGPCAYFAYQVWSFPADSDTPGTGWFAIGVGDVDGDGFGDLALSLRFDPVTEADDFTTWIFSGHDARPLYTIRLDQALFRGFGKRVWAGHQVKPRADEDGDGLADLGVHFGWTGDHERVVLLSGKEGRVLGERVAEFHFGPPMGVQHIRTVDVDGDGVDDFVDNEERRRSELDRPARVEILSGKTFSIIATAEIDSRSQFLRAFELAGDVDGDRIPEIAVTGDSLLVAKGRTWKPAFGVVTIHSGKDGSLLRTYDREYLRALSAGGVPSVIVR